MSFALGQVTYIPNTFAVHRYVSSPRRPNQERSIPSKFPGVWNECMKLVQSHFFYFNSFWFSANENCCYSFYGYRKPIKSAVSFYGLLFLFNLSPFLPVSRSGFHFFYLSLLLINHRVYKQLSYIDSNDTSAMLKNASYLWKEKNILYSDE